VRSLSKFWIPLIAGIFIDFFSLFLTNSHGIFIGGLITGFIVEVFTRALMAGIWLTLTSLFMGHLAWLINWNINHPVREWDSMSPGMGSIFILMLIYSFSTAMPGIVVGWVLTQISWDEAKPPVRSTSSKIPMHPDVKEIVDKILRIYTEKYSHNPVGVLNYHIDRLTKEGHPKEESLLILAERNGICTRGLLEKTKEYKKYSQ